MNIGDKVVCVDDSGQPHTAPDGWKPDDFSFPGGFVEKDAIYCVEAVRTRPNGGPGLRIVGKPILFRYQECEWSHRRFRRIEPRSESVVESVEEQEPVEIR